MLTNDNSKLVVVTGAGGFIGGSLVSLCAAMAIRRSELLTSSRSTNGTSGSTTWKICGLI